MPLPAHVAVVQRPGSAVAQAMDAIRTMILKGELPPGQPLLQAPLAARMGVSRIPIREALRALESEGIVDHTANVGYVVSSLSIQDLAQIYIMRGALERTVLGALAPPSPADLLALLELNEGMAAAAGAADVLLLSRLNREFHFRIFDLSPHNLIVDELRRLWTMAAPYQLVYLYDARSRERVVEEHAAMIELLRAGDLTGLHAQTEAHRAGAEADVNKVLPHGAFMRQPIVPSSASSDSVV
jgi:DNA-binding GntR family transcriptional regulator